VEKKQIVKEIKYLGLVLDSRGKWDKERKQALNKEKIALSSIYICRARAPKIEVKSQNRYIII
jgi:hypothetical protein